jgi:hypothetical protein
MVDTGCRQPAADQSIHPLSGDTPFLAPPPQRHSPVSYHLIPEGSERRPIHRHSIVPIMAQQHRPQPGTLFWDWVVQAPMQFLLEGLHLCSHPLLYRLPQHAEPALPSPPTNECETQEVKGVRLARPPLCSVLVRKSPKLQQSGFVGLQFQLEFAKSLF